MQYENRATDTYFGFGLLVRTGIQQQPHAVRVTTRGGHNKCRLAILPELPRHRTYKEKEK